MNRIMKQRHKKKKVKKRRLSPRERERALKTLTTQFIGADYSPEAALQAAEAVLRKDYKGFKT